MSKPVFRVWIEVEEETNLGYGEEFIERSDALDFAATYEFDTIEKAVEVATYMHKVATGLA
jgi:glycine betaine/choline ABC-type transport system substrate-binding protein